MINFDLKKSRVVDDGQESLLQELKIKSVGGEVVALVGIDGGSTSTRVSIVDNEDLDDLDNFMKMYVIPSTHSEISSNEVIEPQSNALIDRMDSIILNEKVSNDTMFDKVRILRATKKSDSNKNTISISSSEQKVDSAAFYINLIDAIGYALIQKYADRCPDTFRIKVGASMRPDDLQGKKNQQKFHDRTVGSYKWVNQDLNVSIKIIIEDVAVQSEPEAALRGNYISSGEETPALAVLVEGGGSSFGVEVLKNGNRQASLSRTFEYGGTQLKQMINDKYVEEFGGANLTNENLELALKEGIIKRGRNVMDISSIVIDCKNEFSKNIMNDVMKEIFDRTTSFKIIDVETFIFSGRIFRPGDFGEGKGYSLTEPLSNKIVQLNPAVEFVTLTENFIPFGNLILAVNNWADDLLSDDDYEDESEEAIESNSIISDVFEN